ncbi:acid protease [Epithele typhae]|uniref:acid protease n=1 Tax=Epithele typhae TaxID=378194 RepID=UPI002007E83A|nr:acid protease [Epithele typhae]KAH9942431.1 acid protease [Epithele typhae]
MSRSAFNPLSVLVLYGLASFCSPIREPASGFRIRLERREVNATDVFESSYATREREATLVKYSNADQFLSGIGLHPDTHPERSYPAFTPPNSSVTVRNAPLRGMEYTLDNPDANSTDPDLLHRASSLDGDKTERLALQDFVSGGLDVEYYGPLAFGTPAQMLDVDIDTGSADLWVPSRCSRCTNGEFQPSRAHLPRGSGRVSGMFAQDKVAVGSLSVPNQAFCAARRVSDDFDEQPASGLLGLAFGSIATAGQPTFFENLLTEKALADSVFSVHLARGEETGPRCLCLGCYDTSKADAAVQWHPLVSRTYWSIAMDGIVVNKRGMSHNLTAVVDTGTSLIYVPDEIPGSAPAVEYGPGKPLTFVLLPGFFSFPCNASVSVALKLDGHSYTIHPSDFNLGAVKNASTECVGGILALGDGFAPDMAIVGAEFLKSWYTVFDYAGRVGFAPSINNLPAPAAVTHAGQEN